MDELGADLLAEYCDLANLCETLSAEQWTRHTAFHGWTPWDEIAHLLYFDEAALLAVNDPGRFATDAARLAQEIAAGQALSAIARRDFADLDGPALLARWRERHTALVAALVGMDAKARLPWYGPPMSARSFAAARLMETWAHGQDIWDMLGRERVAGPGLRHIAHLGVTTYGWTFANRKLTIPEPKPYVRLQAPEGDVWEWGEPSSQDFVHGPAVDFALLATQRRNRADTRLVWGGASAELWTRYAQCFAGEPADGPRPGERVSPG